MDALGHTWGTATYKWADDYSTVTATRVCGRDSSHQETETVAATGQVTKAATCEAKGETTYTSAAFTNTAFTQQSKTVENVNALGHTLTKTDPPVFATTTEGVIECWTCSTCGKLFSDTEGENEITQDDSAAAVDVIIENDTLINTRIEVQVNNSGSWKVISNGSNIIKLSEGNALQFRCSFLEGEGDTSISCLFGSDESDLQPVEGGYDGEYRDLFDITIPTNANFVIKFIPKLFFQINPEYNSEGGEVAFESDGEELGDWMFQAFSTISLTITPNEDEGYTFENLIVKDNKGKKIDLPIDENGKVILDENGTVSFQMPKSYLTANVSFVKDTYHTITIETTNDGVVVPRVNSIETYRAEAEAMVEFYCETTGYRISEIKYRESGSDIDIDVSIPSDQPPSIIMPANDITVIATVEKEAYHVYTAKGESYNIELYDVESNETSDFISWGPVMYDEEVNFVITMGNGVVLEEIMIKDEEEGAVSFVHDPYNNNPCYASFNMPASDVWISISEDDEIQGSSYTDPADDTDTTQGENITDPVLNQESASGEGSSGTQTADPEGEPGTADSESAVTDSCQQPASDSDETGTQKAVPKDESGIEGNEETQKPDSSQLPASNNDGTDTQNTDPKGESGIEGSEEIQKTDSNQLPASNNNGTDTQNADPKGESGVEGNEETQKPDSNQTPASDSSVTGTQNAAPQNEPGAADSEQTPKSDSDTEPTSAGGQGT